MLLLLTLAAGLVGPRFSFLAFREVGPLRALLERLRERQPALVPQVLLVDGNGVLHQRSAGACALLAAVGAASAEPPSAA